MKTIIFSTVLVFMGFGLSLNAQDLKIEKFKVAGNCGMCEKRIEGAAGSVEGVSSSDWNKQTKMIKVSFDSTKTDLNKIHMAIADAGHDTEMHKANDDVYNKLPACCKYPRMKKERGL